MKWLLFLLPLCFANLGCERHGAAELAQLEPAHESGAEHAGPAAAVQATEPKSAPDASGPKYFKK